MSRTLSRFSALPVLIVVVAMLLVLTSCAAQEPSKAEDPEQTTRIAIRNGTTWGGLAAMAGELLKDEGFVSENGYTIDIGNVAPESKHCIMVCDDNGAAYQDAMRLRDAFGIAIFVAGDQFDAFLKDYHADKSDIVIVFAAGYFDNSFTNKYADLISKYDYPDQPIGDYSVLQIEPYVAGETAKEVD